MATPMSRPLSFLSPPFTLLIQLATLLLAVPGPGWAQEPVESAAVIELPGGLLAARDKGTIYRSTDGGASWQLVGNAGSPIIGASFFADSGGRLFVSRGTVFDGLSHPAIARSTDGGATWEDVLALTNPDSKTMEIIGDGRGSIYLGEYSNLLPRTPFVYRSDDGGDSWSVKQFPGKHVHSLAYDAAGDRVLVAIGDETDVAGVYDYATGERLNSLKVADVMALSTGQILYLSDLGAQVDGCYGNYIARSDGAVFDLPFNHHSEVMFGAECPATGVLVAGTSTLGDPAVPCVDLWVSPDGGVTWGSLYQNCDYGPKGYLFPRIAGGYVWVRDLGGHHFRFPVPTVEEAWDAIRRMGGDWEDGRTYRLGFFGESMANPNLTLAGTAPAFNLACKSSFEEPILWGSDYTRHDAGGTIEVTDTEARSGTRCLRVVSPGGGDRPYLKQTVLLSASDPVPAGTTLSVSAYVKIPRGSNATIEPKLTVRYVSGSGETVTGKRHGYERDWHRNSVALTLGQDAVEVSYLLVFSGEGTLLVDDAMVAPSTEPPPYFDGPTARTPSWGAVEPVGTGPATVRVNGQAFEFPALAQGEQASRRLSGVTLSGLASFQVEVAGNHHAGYRLDVGGAAAGNSLEPERDVWVAPNPVAREALIGFGLAEPGPVSVAVYDVTGRRVTTLTRRFLAGSHAIPWDAGAVAPGVYYLRVDGPGMHVVRTVIVAR